MSSSASAESDDEEAHRLALDALSLGDALAALRIATAAARAAAAGTRRAKSWVS